MGSGKQYDGIDPYAAGLIKYKARRLIGQAGFTASDREDIEQELILDLLRRLPKYDPKRAQRNTFIARVVEHRVATLIEAQKAGIRDYRRCRCSLNDRFEDEDGRSVERVDTFDQEDYLLRTGAQSMTAAELSALAIDVTAVLEGLPHQAAQSVSAPQGRDRSPRSPATRAFRAVRSTNRSRSSERSSKTPASGTTCEHPDGPGVPPVGNHRTGRLTQRFEAARPAA